MTALGDVLADSKLHLGAQHAWCCLQRHALPRKVGSASANVASHIHRSGTPGAVLGDTSYQERWVVPLQTLPDAFTGLARMTWPGAATPTL